MLDLFTYPLRMDGLDVGERGQCRVRFLLAAVSFAFYALAHLTGLATGLVPALYGIGAYLLYSYCWGWVVALEIGSTPARLTIGMMLESALFAAVFSISGASLGPLMWVPISTTLGYGLRFQHRWGTLSTIVGSCTMAGAMVVSPYWRGTPGVAIGLLFAISFIPAYALRLNRRVQMAHRDAEKRALEFLISGQTDALTGLLNRRGFEDALESLASSVVERHSIHALLYVDLDRFKQVNDTFGHAIGDAMLGEVAQMIRAAVRSSDLVARLGGDEFAILLSGLGTADDAVKIAETVLRSIESARVKGYPEASVSACIGVSLLESKKAVTVEQMLSAADAFMFEGKRTGKGRVVASPIFASS